MKNLIATAAVGCLVATGCVQTTDQISEALPLSQDLQVKVPQESGEQPLALGQIADYYRITRNISVQFNGGAALALTLVHLVVQYPATAVEGNTYTWGPHPEALDPAEWRLVVTDNLDGTYDWTLDGRSKTEDNAEFLPLMFGNAVEGAEPHRGSGTLNWNGDNARAVNPVDNEDAHGTVTIVYDLENRDGTQASLDMDIQGLDEDSGEPVEATYHYAESIDGSGDFEFEFKADLEDDGSAAEDAVIRSRWLNDGAGRSDVRVRGGDLAEIVVEGSECWDTQFRRVYYSDSAQWAPSEGEVSDCAFAEADLPDA